MSLPELSTDDGDLFDDPKEVLDLEDEISLPKVLTSLFGGGGGGAITRGMPGN